MSDMTDASGQMPRRNPRVSDGGAPVSGAVAIVLALVAVVAGFLILNAISNGGEDALDFPVDSSNSSGDDGDAGTATTVDPSATTVATLAPEPTTPPIVTDGASVLVANANNVGGSAGQMQRALETGPGFTVVGAVNASTSVGTLETSVIYYEETNAQAQPVAESLGEVLGGVTDISPMPDTPPTADGDLMGADVLLMLGNDKAGKTLEELNPDTATGGATQVTSPPVAGDTSTETTAG
ncbi:MAG: LytR C-terminal domain-containing protein [Ilumatobacter fluminis]|uniref:LytR C-terminal domain-containing protein n=1 Tax=Ilumatobacter fluminis TaxID=467091 RepID=UPI0032EC96E0